ncbi:hypothetical protein B0H11DRAFT_1854032 [Mycena galericulata]|nr:hypothetical protein B0H11DRAFT_1854032 [Mycena galericulata]
MTLLSQGRYPGKLGVVIRGGATKRSAAQALATLGLHPIYLVNRDVAEVEAGEHLGFIRRRSFPNITYYQAIVQTALPKLTLVHLRHPDQVEVAGPANVSADTHDCWRHPGIRPSYAGGAYGIHHGVVHPVNTL